MKSKSLSRYLQIRSELIDEIVDGHYPVGSRFPGEEEIQQRFDVGRHTAREALKALSDEGYIDRRKKSGTTVLSLKPTVHFSQLLGTIENLFDFGTSTEFEILEFEHVCPGVWGVGALHTLQANTEHLRIAGVRWRHGLIAPLCWSEFFIPAAYAIERSLLTDLYGPIYAKVFSHHGLELDHVEQEIGADTLGRLQADILRAPQGSAALVQTRRYFEANGELIQSTVNIYPAGRYVMQTSIRRSALINRP